MANTKSKMKYRASITALKELKRSAGDFSWTNVNGRPTGGESPSAAAADTTGGIRIG